MKISSRDRERYLLSIPANGISLGNRHAHYRTIKTFFHWLQVEYRISSPVTDIKAPRLPKLVLPSLTTGQVLTILDKTGNARDQAIITSAIESGIRVTELAIIKPKDIEWESRTIKVLGKGMKEAYAPFGELSNKYLRAWLSQYSLNGNIWGINKNGIQTMLQRLETATGLPCNPHTFRSIFACLLRKAGIDTMTIKDLGR